MSNLHEVISMKGFMEEITWTVLIWIFLAVFIIISLIQFVFLSLPWGQGSISYSVEFSDMSNKPYLVAEVLTHYRIPEIENRKLIELCTEAAIINRLDYSIGDPVKDFMDKYGISYSIVLDNGNELLSIGESGKDFTEAAIPLLYKGTIGYLKVSTK